MTLPFPFLPSSGAMRRSVRLATGLWLGLALTPSIARAQGAARPADARARDVASASREAAPATSASSLVFVVRHAERESRERDSDLSAAGVARAHALDSALADARLTHVIVTEFRRTANTAAPAARRHGLVPIVVANQPDVAAHAAAVAAAVRNAGPDAVVLVVGHSNTVPRIVEALGGPARPDLCDQQYATLTVVRLGGPGAPARVARLQYGAPDVPDADACKRTMATPR